MNANIGKLNWSDRGVSSASGDFSHSLAEADADSDTSAAEMEV